MNWIALSNGAFVNIALITSPNPTLKCFDISLMYIPLVMSRRSRFKKQPSTHMQLHTKTPKWQGPEQNSFYVLATHQNFKSSRLKGTLLKLQYEKCFLNAVFARFYPNTTFKKRDP